MKLILAIISADAIEAVSRALVEQRYSVTQIGSVGGFLRKGSTTLVIGIQDNQLEPALHTIREVCKSVKQTEEHAATVFVLNANQFVQI